MALWRTREELVHHTVVLTGQGMSRRAVARALGVSRNTVREIMREHAAQRDAGHSALPSPVKRAPRRAKVDAWAPRVEELFRRYPDITAQRVFETLRDEGFAGSYTGVKHFVSRTRPKPKPPPSLEAPVYGPGKMAECDWSPYDVTYTSGLRRQSRVAGAEDSANSVIRGRSARSTNEPAIRGIARVGGRVGRVGGRVGGVERDVRGGGDGWPAACSGATEGARGALEVSERGSLPPGGEREPS